MGDDYVWKLFLNFTQRKRIVWINRKQIEYLRRIKYKDLTANVEFADRFAKIADDGSVALGDYTKLLKAHNSMQVAYAEEFKWEVSNKELLDLKNGKCDKKKGITCRDFWDCETDVGRCTFGGNMVLDYHDSDGSDSEQKEDDAKVGFVWRVSSHNGCSSVVVDVELHCPQI